MSEVECKLPNTRALPKRRVARKDMPDAKKRPHKRDTLRRVSTREICSLTRQLATLLNAGMPLVPALRALAEQLQSILGPKIARFGSGEDPIAVIIEQVADDVNAGSTLADALAKHPDVFSNLFVNMVAAGEAGGALEETLLHLAEMMEKRLHLVAKVKLAVAYPLMMIVVAIGVVVFLLSFVVPTITGIFLEMNRTLPWPTRLLISASAFTKTYCVSIVIVACVALFGIAAAYKTKEGRLFVDRYKLKLPLFGSLFLKLEIARLTRTLGTLLICGIPILNAIEIAKRVVQNSFIAAALDSVKGLVSRGDNIANAIQKTRLFPPIVFHIIATGQISGEIETGLINIADMYDDEVEITAKTLTSLLEPAILLLMGGIVGFIVMAILLPIFEINQLI
ncbi:MAG: type II secretion system F family protein [Sedimentisphaerales bacterium]|nr:type II secretion system F family protein [Sedimentisphaerales bacterium]